MGKIFILTTALLMSFIVNASGEAVCPSSLTCDYDSGICETPSGWSADTGGASEVFSGSQTFDLSRIWAFKQGSPPNDVYQFECVYNYGKSSSISIYTYTKALTGSNWVFSGFGKNKAECSDVTDPTSCAGTSQVSGTIDYKLHIQQTYEPFEPLPLATPPSCNNSCKKKTIRTRGNPTHFYCLSKSEFPSGWGWVTEGNPQAALPLCECHPASRPDGYSVSCS